MGISFSNGNFVIDDVYATFEDIRLYDVYYGLGKVTKSSSTYTINAGIILQNYALLKDTSKTIYVNGNVFQVRSGSTLQLGNKSSATSTSVGCKLYIPNILFEYGFGSLDPNDSGNLLCYSSTIEAYGFWSFFTGNNTIEIINSTIDGFGKLSGSIYMYGVIFKRYHPKYGNFTFDSQLVGYTNVKITALDKITVNDQRLPSLDSIINVISTGPDKRIELSYGDYYGDSDLLYVLDNQFNLPIYMYGSLVANGYNLNYLSNNRNNFYHKFKFNPRVQDIYGNILSNSLIKITNRLGVVEYEGVVDANGYIHTWLTYYQDLAGSSAGAILTPHTIEVTNGDNTATMLITVDKNMEDIPLVISNQSIYGDTGVTREDIETIVQASESDVMNRIDNLDLIIRDLILSVGDKVQITTQTVKHSSGVSFTI